MTDQTPPPAASPPPLSQERLAMLSRLIEDIRGVKEVKPGSPLGIISELWDHIDALATQLAKLDQALEHTKELRAADQHWTRQFHQQRDEARASLAAAEERARLLAKALAESEEQHKTFVGQLLPLLQKAKQEWEPMEQRLAATEERARLLETVLNQVVDRMAEKAREAVATPFVDWSDALEDEAASKVHEWVRQLFLTAAITPTPQAGGPNESGMPAVNCDWIENGSGPGRFRICWNLGGRDGRCEEHPREPRAATAEEGHYGE